MLNSFPADDEQRLEVLRREIRPALEELDRGEGQPLDIEQIKAEVRAKLAHETGHSI